MGFLLRDKKDGRRTAGYGIYLAGGLLALTAILYLHGRLRNDAAPTPRAPARASHVDAVTESAAGVSKVDVRRPAAERDASFRIAAQPAKETRRPKAEVESFSAIRLALAASAGPTPTDGATGRLDEARASKPSQPALPELAPSLLPAAVSSPSEVSPSTAQLFGYRDTAADKSRELDPTSVQATETPLRIPKGVLIEVALLTTVDTRNPAAIIQFAATRPLVWDHRARLPFGARFFGRIGGSPKGARMNLSVDGVLFRAGREWRQVSVNATAVEANADGADIHPGLAAYFYPPAGWAQLAPYVGDFARGYVSLLAEQAQRPFSASIGAVTVQSSAGTDARPLAYQASAQAIQDLTAERVKDFAQRYPSYYLIPAGTACWLQLESDLDLAPVKPPDGAKHDLNTSETLPLSSTMHKASSTSAGPPSSP